MASAQNGSIFSSLTSYVDSTVAVALLCAVTTYALWTNYNWRGKPPGPWGFPIVGHLPLLGSNPHEKLLEWRRRYGDVYSLRMGSGSGIVLSGVNVIKEALVKKTDDFAGRKENILIETLTHAKGMIFFDFNERWKLHRKITNHVIRMFANNKANAIEDLIIEEAKLLVSVFESERGQAFDPHEAIFVNVGSVIYQMLYGKQENLRDDSEYKAFAIDTKKSQEPLVAVNVAVVLPWTRHFMRGMMRRMKTLAESGQKKLQKRVDQHKSTFDPDNLRDITDGFIKAGYELTENDKALGLTENQLLQTINELLGAGFDTVAGTLVWSVLYMVCHEEVQTKVQQELDRVVGTSRYPRLNDRSSLPYTQATILEVLRMSSLAPLAVPHKTTKDTEIGGYFIPKDTDVYINLFSVHMDSSWGDPRVFRPERFLTTEGEVDTAIVENILPFGAGRRRCLGEYLAKVELFIFFSFLLQQFYFTAPPDETPSLEAVFGFTLKPKCFKLIATSRL